MTHPPLPIRNFNAEQDLLSLLRLLNEIAVAEQSGKLTFMPELQASMQLPGHDPNQDCFVAEFPDEPGRLAGYGATWLPPASDAAGISLHVHPKWRGAGLSDALLERIAARSRSLGAAHMQMTLDSRRPGVADFLVTQGFTYQGAYTEMRAPGDQDLPRPNWPTGFMVRTYALIQDLSLLTDAMNLCYQGLWGHQEVSQTQVAEWLTQWNEDSLFLIFAPGREIAGISRVEISAERTAKNEQPTGYIDAPGFTAKFRRHELYRALLLTGMRWLQSQNQSLIEMESWGDLPEILQMYRGLGFNTLRQFTAYQRSLKD